MRPVITTRSLLAAIEAKRRAEAAQRWEQSFRSAPERADAVTLPLDIVSSTR